MFERLRNEKWDEARALEELWGRSAYDRGFVTDPFAGDAAAGLGLRRTAAILEALDAPQDAYPTIHVAGSKGKGSTSAMLASILKAAGARVGLHTSPHLHDFRERFVVDGNLIEPNAFGVAAQRVFAAARSVEGRRPELSRATAFELSTAIALDYFRTAGCQVAVVEVGMGGTLDATNVVDPIVSVITALDLEHVAVLGPGMAEIAANKAGIIKPGRPAVSVHQPAPAEEVIGAAAAATGSRLLLEGRDWRVNGGSNAFTASGPWGSLDGLRSGLAGDHQVQNAGAAIAALWAAQESLPVVSHEAIASGLESVVWPGRYERIVRPDLPVVVLDGAHTPASAEALATTVRREGTAGAVVAIVGMFSDKDPESFLSPLARMSARVAFIIVPAPSPRTADPTAVAAAANRLGISAVVEPDVAAAMTRGQSIVGATGLVVVTGSLSVVAAARVALGLVGERGSVS